MIESNPLVGEDTILDQNMIELQLLIKYLIRTLKLILIILNFSYFLGMFWLSISDINEDAAYDYYYNVVAEEEEIFL